MRFVSMPSFGSPWFAITVRPQAIKTTGVLVVIERSGIGDLETEARRTFSIPLPAYRVMVARADRLSDSWIGDRRLWFDWTPVAFERVGGADVISGIGKPGTHCGKLASIARDALAPYLPEVVHLDYEGMEPATSERR